LKIPVDFSDVQQGGAVPAGDYPAVIADCLLKQKPGADHAFLNWDCVIAEGELEGRHQFMVSSFAPGAKWKMQEAFINLGYAELEFELEIDDATGQLINPEVIGLPCVIQVFQEPYNNRMTSKISTILGPNGEGAAPAEQPAATAPATRPATRTAPKAAPATAAKAAPNGGVKRSPFPATAAARQFKR
jgi:hypothetical protein